MSAVQLDKIFHPKSIAVIGAGQVDQDIGSKIIHNLIEGGYSGEVYPITPHRRSIGGLPTCAALADLNVPVDLVVIIEPFRMSPEIVMECKKIGAGGVLDISAGGKDARAYDVELETAVRTEARRSGLRIIGPNSIGLICCQSKLNASIESPMPLPGKTAFVSQSGAMCTSVLDLAVKERIGFSYVVHTGSMLDVDFGDIIDYLGGDPEVNSIMMYVESLNRFRNFMSAARAVSRIKPIIVLKAGRTQAGTQAAASHTGTMVGEDQIYDAAFKRAGIVRVRTFEELFDCAELLAKQPRPNGPGLAIITNAGGPGVMAADALSDHGINPAILRPKTLEKLDAILPPGWCRSNPIDILEDASPELYLGAIDVCLKAFEVNGILIILTPQVTNDPTFIAETLANHLKRKTSPVFTAWMGGPAVEKGREIFNRAGIPTFDTPERSVRAFLNLYKYSKNIETLQEIPAKFPRRLAFDAANAQSRIQKQLATGKMLMTEVEAKTLLAAYGIPVNPTKLATSGKEAIACANEIGFPVAMKICSPDIPHKADAGGILLDLRNPSEVDDAYQKIMGNAYAYNPKAVIEGVTIQAMMSLEYELILGSKKDRDFGPVILFGMGGIWTEVLKDQAIALPPLNRLLAKRLLEDTKIYRLLEGYRGHPPVNLLLLEEVLIRLSQLVTDFPEIEELDINPLAIGKDAVCAVDARVLLKPTQVPAPLHLVISPYPGQYESRILIEDVGELFIRPIRPEDASLMVQLFESLSPQSIYFRFFSPLKILPFSMLARFTQIDYDREIALVALHGSDSDERMLGVARIVTGADQKHGEFSVIVGDPYHGKGIGKSLLTRCLAIAKERGMESVWGPVLAENTQMLALGRKLGFTVKRVLGSSEYDLTIDLTKIDSFSK